MKRTIIAVNFPRQIAIGDTHTFSNRFARDAGEDTPWDIEELQPGRLKLRSRPREGRRDAHVEFEYVGFGYSLTYAVQESEAAGVPMGDASGHGPKVGGSHAGGNAATGESGEAAPTRGRKAAATPKVEKDPFA